MIAIDRYKDMIDEVGRVLSIFANYEDSVILQRWTIGTIHSIQVKVMDYAGVAVAQIKRELVGDGKEAEYRGRLRTAFYELSDDPNFVPSYFPVFDEAIFELPSKDNPENNRQMLKAFTAIYGSEGNAADVMISLQAIAQWANVIVGDVSKMLDSVCKFVGYTPEPQKEPQEATEIELQASTRQEPQQAEQGQESSPEQPQEIPTINKTDRERLIFGRALEKQYMSLENGKYKWHKSYSLLAYMCGRLFCGDRVVEADDEEKLNKGVKQMPKAAVERLFGVNVAGNRYVMKEPPRDYWIIDDLFKGASR